MSEFTYDSPDETNYMKAIIAQLKSEGLEPIANLLKGCTCEISHSQQFSYIRWNGFRTVVRFYVPLDKYEAVSKMLANYDGLVQICNDIMPPKAGLDVMEVKFSPSLEDTQLEKSMMEDLENSSEVLSTVLIEDILAEEIKSKGKEMSDAYIYLYCVENTLRTFIERIAKENYGDDYFSSLKINKDIETKLDIRKKEEIKNQWIRLRGDSEIFYLDFEDLASIISNNWDIFKNYFPSEYWITTKIQELSKCRNLVAHNSYIENNERELIRVYFNAILKQISSAYRN
jgi:hypothetical protein